MMECTLTEWTLVLANAPWTPSRMCPQMAPEFGHG